MYSETISAVRLAAFLLISAPTIGFAQTSSAPDAHAIIRQILERNPSLGSFQTRVHVRVRMLNFPFISLGLDGTSYYRRPDNYEVVFDRVPGYASGLKHVFADIADPASWERDWNVACTGLHSIDGRSLLQLQMTKKIPFNGGSIVMTQTYKVEGSYWVIASQHADIQIPHVRAVADATYDSYQTNVALDDSVFARR